MGGDPGKVVRQYRAWRRQSTRRALRQGANVRNQYAAPSSNPGKLATSFPPCSLGAKLASVVKLHVYDFFERNTNRMTGFLGLGAFHAGLEVYGIEWSYGASFPDEEDAPQSGVYPIIPKTSDIGVYRETVYLGHAHAHTARDVWHLLEHLACAWLGLEYHLFGHNCLDFCVEFDCQLEHW